MSYLLSFDPNKNIALRETNTTEKQLFEAFWVGFRGGDVPGYENLEHSLTLKLDIKKNSIEGDSSFKLSSCPTCRQRWMQYDKQSRTIDSKFDLVIENDTFEYLKSCFARWSVVSDDLQEYFLELKRRFSDMRPKSPGDWAEFIKERDSQS